MADPYSGAIWPPLRDVGTVNHPPPIGYDLIDNQAGNPYPTGYGGQRAGPSKYAALPQPTSSTSFHNPVNNQAGNSNPTGYGAQRVGAYNHGPSTKSASFHDLVNDPAGASYPTGDAARRGGPNIYGPPVQSASSRNLVSDQSGAPYPTGSAAQCADPNIYGPPPQSNSYRNQVNGHYYGAPQPIPQPYRQREMAYPMRYGTPTDYARSDSEDDVISFNQRPNRPQSLTFLQLPGEIRNLILRFALVPGAVFPPAYRSLEFRKRDTPIDLVRQATTTENKIPGIPLLGVNQQVHREACTLFFSTNTFYLPPGPVDEATVYFSFLCPAHKAQIRKIGIRWSLADLTASAIAQFQIGNFSMFSVPPSTVSLLNTLEKCLAWMWTSKWNWIAKFHAAQVAAGGQGIETVTVEGNFAPTVVIRGRDLSRMTLTEPKILDDQTWLLPQSLAPAANRNKRSAGVVLNNHIRQHGWVATSDLLGRGGGWWNQ